MESNYCLPIIAGTKETVIQKISDHFSDYSYFEIWLDYISDLDTDFIDYLISNYEERIIFLFRRQNLEDIKMSLDQREKIMWQVANSKAFLDLDFLTQKDELSYLKEKNLKLNLILSFHDYEKTPGFPQMIDIVREMEDYHPSIYKFSCFCNDDKDGLKLLNLLMTLKEDGKKYIVLGMGQRGTLTRVAGALWGNQMNFVPIRKDEVSAPGQLTKEELEEVLKILGGR